MRFRRFDLNLLVALDVLLEERNVSRAAHRLHLSQSAMSGALARLRDYFGDEIMVMVGRTMVPTPLALALVEPVRDILIRVQTTIEARPTFDPATAQRVFRVVASDYVTEVVLARAIRRLRREAPGLRLEISAVADDIHDRLNRADVDLVISPDAYLTSDQPKEVLFEETHSCVVWRDNAAVGDSLTFEQYLDMTHVVVIIGGKRTPAFEQWFLDRYGYARTIGAVAPDFSSVAPILVETDMISTMHTRLARLYAQHLPLRVLPAPIEFPVLTEMMQWHYQFDRDPGLIWLRGYLRECAGE
ncbi:LysR family transcriptional regulator [Nitrospirillum viridazoti]|uniref:LysR family transcriptional regulator n=1 Tax=Nitrospirillum amazonense TaxID=28077 RepID=A0A560IXM0_9PROT|nr:LysR family transcriptional regulator [Nitrospirillum amazonense]TWB63656.1 LysR family transcriptional regulator [Nitrospirillum amazonense]